MAYLLDTNIFIEAKNLHYGFDFCPAFWEWLIASNAAQKVFSIEKVGDELAAGSDDLSIWAAQRGPGFFLKPDSAILQALGSVSNWVMGQRYEQVGQNIFFQSADYYLIAHALAHGHTVVTHEKAANSTKRIKIPNPCIGLNIKCVTPFEMLRYERARFILKA
jgi:hypothetical protein